MNILDLIQRNIPPDPWAEGEKIPWHDPEFSSRMLHEHLSQDHDAASRRTEIIDQHVRWIHAEVLSGAATKILDLCCGPGLYTSRLAKLGHRCVGIDYALASIAYARQEVDEQDLDCRYVEADVRDAAYGSGYGLVMMINGELNVFRPEEARGILEKANTSTSSGGRLVIEVHTSEAVRAIGEQGSTWTAVKNGLFSESPHGLLKEAFWSPNQHVATERYYVVEARTGAMTRYAASIQGYEEEEYVEFLTSCGYGEIHKHASLAGKGGAKDKSYVVYMAKKAKPGGFKG